MRLLLTRAVDDAARTRAKLEALGHHVLMAPVLEIVPLPVRWPAGVIDAVVATSGHAFAALRDADRPPGETRRLMPLYLVGTRTAAQARAAGFNGAAVVAAQASELVPRLAGLDGKRVVYLAGRDRKPDVEHAVARAGTLHLLESYEARTVDALAPASKAALDSNAVDAVLHFSPRSAMQFAMLVDQVSARLVRHLCLSREVATPLQAAGFVRVEVAKTPDEQALLALVEDAQA